MNLLLIGCGNIGGALLKLWSSLNIFSRIIVVQPSLSSLSEYHKNKSIKFVEAINAIPKDFVENVTVLALKPQDLDRVMPDFLQRPPTPMLVSLLTGIRIKQLSSIMLINSKIIRIMPNISIKIGQSVNLAFTTHKLNNQDLNIIETIFRPSGLIVWVNSEKHLDGLTTISGSGPAYFFLLAEALVAETIKMGIDETVARRLIQQVFIGSAGLVHNNNFFGSLITSVASKGGVTEAALKVMVPSIKQIIKKALKAALTRLEELSDENCS